MNSNNAINNLFWLNKSQSILVVEQSKKTITKRHYKITDVVDFVEKTKGNVLSQFSLLTAINGVLLKKYFNDFNGLINSKNTLINDKNENYFFLEIDINSKEDSLKNIIQNSAIEVQKVLKHINYDTDKFQLNDYSNYGIVLGKNSVNEQDCNGLLLSFQLNDNDLELTVYFVETFIKEHIVDHFALNFNKIIQNISEYLDVNFDRIRIVSDLEKHQILNEFNNTITKYPSDKNIIQLFEEQVKKRPNNIALTYQDVNLTYCELNEQVNQFSNYLKANYNVKNEQIVGVLLPKSVNSIVSFLAILKLGGVYLPIDPNYPIDRINHIIEDSKINLIIVQKKINFSIPESINVVEIENIDLKSYSKNNLNIEISPNNLAYLIYTSGSTGKPKGVLIEHHSNINMSLDQIRKFEIEEKDKVVWFASVSFDASISEIMMCLYSGATLTIPTETQIKDKDIFIEFLKSTKSTVITFPPSYLNLLEVKELQGLKCVITAGEPANPLKAKELFLNGVNYYNAYGPTEYSVCTSIYKLNDSDVKIDNTSIPIGKPISNTQVYILDEELNIVPIGVLGKLYVSGAGLSRGYLNKPELTAEKFIDNPFEEGTKMYDTGDLAKWLPEGNIEFLGRKDFQVKIRGFRIELGEVETNVLQFSKDITQVVAEAKEINGDKVLVAYYTKDSEVIINKTELREYLQAKLPEYMIPGFLVELDNIPLTPNGKINRKALPGVKEEDLIRRQYVAPRNEIEQKLVEIWQEVLGVERVGITDNFFELGGHSLMVAQVLNRINQKLSMQVNFKIFFASPTIGGIAKSLIGKEYLPIPKAPEKEGYPLTPAQNRMWILSQLEGGALAYNLPGIVKFTGIIDFDKFSNSFVRLINRHEILRTSFHVNKDGEIQQYIVPVEDINFSISQRNLINEKNQEKAIEDYLQKCNNEPFDLESAPLVRAYLIQTKVEEYVFFLSLHHIIGDGWSIELLISEVIKTYNSLVQGKELSLPPLRTHYKDYAVWLKDNEQYSYNQASEKYWIKQFEGEIPVLSLPSFKARPLLQTFKGDSHKHVFSNNLLEKLKTFSLKYDVTLFMTLMAGVKSLLYRYTGQNDIVIGTPVAGRAHPDLENQIGLYLNTLAIRTIFKEKYSFLDLLKYEKENLLNAYEHENYPFDELVNKLNLRRDTSRNALYDVLIILQNQVQIKNLNNEKFTGFDVSDYDFKRKTSHVDISFNFIEKEDLELTINYNSDIYDDFLIENMFTHFEKLITQSINNVEIEIDEIDYLADSEKHQLLEEFNNSKVEDLRNETIIDLFEEQVEKTSENIAVIFEDKHLTYQELNEQSNQLANYILTFKNLNNNNNNIGINIKNSEFIIIALLGVLKSGNSYVIIDPKLPIDRLNYFINDSNCKLIINDEFLINFNQSLINLSSDNLNVKISIEDAIYLMYTSGSTGLPKGAINIHKGFLNTIKWYANDIGIQKNDKIGVISNMSFDLTQKNYFAALTTGAKIFIVNDINDILEVSKFISKNKISIINCAPTMLYNLIDNDLQSLESLEKIILGGETIDILYVNKVKSKFKNIIFINSYGPSEASDVVLYHKLRNEEEQNIPIGKPIRNNKAFILNAKKKLSNIGVIGELHIGGVGLGLGYFNKPELTAEKFINNPFSAGTKIYNTGDLARWLPDGNIEFLGRKDFQIKIRGHRIELGEIEVNISEFDIAIKQVVVDAKEVNGEKLLVAYYTKDNEIVIDKTELRQQLQTKLPEYMIPSFFVELETIPLTPNGKIDRKALPSVTSEDLIRKVYVAPRNTTEQKLVEIWQEVLGLEKVGISDNFFELGGHSLQLLKIYNLIKVYYDETEFKLSDLFTKYTIEQQSETIKKTSNKNFSKKRHKLKAYRMSTIVQYFWTRAKASELAKNISFGIVCDEKLLYSDINQSYIKVKQENTILHSFVQDTSFPSFVPHSKIEPLQIVSCQNRREAETFCNTLHESKFDFSLKNLIVGYYIIIEKSDERILFFSVPHLIFDGISLTNFWESLFEFYKNPEKPVLVDSFSYISINRDVLTDINNLQYKYWSNKFTALIGKPFTNIKKIDNIKRNQGISEKLDITNESNLITNLESFCKSKKISLHNFFASIFLVATQKNSIEFDCLCFDYHCRNQSNIKSLGFFVQNLFAFIDSNYVNQYDLISIINKVDLEINSSKINSDIEIIKIINNTFKQDPDEVLNHMKKIRYNYYDTSQASISLNREIIKYLNYKNTFFIPTYLHFFVERKSNNIQIELMGNNYFIKEIELKRIITNLKEIIINLIANENQQNK